LQMMPETVLKISRLLPMTYMVQLLQGLWFGELWLEHLKEVIILARILLVSALVAAKTFRWE